MTTGSFPPPQRPAGTDDVSRMLFSARATVDDCLGELMKDLTNNAALQELPRDLSGLQPYFDAGHDRLRSLLELQRPLSGAEVLEAGRDVGLSLIAGNLTADRRFLQVVEDFLGRAGAEVGLQDQLRKSFSLNRRLLQESPETMDYGQGDFYQRVDAALDGQAPYGVGMRGGYLADLVVDRAALLRVSSTATDPRSFTIDPWTPASAAGVRGVDLTQQPRHARPPGGAPRPAAPTASTAPRSA